MIAPDNKAEVIALLQGKWERNDKQVSFVITGSECTQIKGTGPITEMSFELDFNPISLKWQLSSLLFGINSAITHFENDSFTVHLENDSVILPEIAATEHFHREVQFKR